MVEKVSDVSGWGVGMDVVWMNIEKFGGIVDVEFEIGKGMFICIMFLFMLVIIFFMLVCCCGEWFVIL